MLGRPGAYNAGRRGGMIGAVMLGLLGGAQFFSAARVTRRMLATAGGDRIAPVTDLPPTSSERLTVIVPVLNEALRLAPLLDGLLTQTGEVGEVLVVDGGSTDGTRAVAQAYAARDARLHVLDAGSAPSDWNGKVWNLQHGLESAAQASTWVLTLDADVRVQPLLARSLLAFARQTQVRALSVATRQRLTSAAEALIHPAQLTTLVYRFGAPGAAARHPAQVQANGQCALYRRDVLEAVGGFAVVRESICEDITLARLLARKGERVGFYEGGDLVAAEMYASAGESWREWSRSLPLRDRYWGIAGVWGLLDVLLAQGLPLPFLVLLAVGMRWQFSRMLLCLGALNAALLVLRLGALTGTARAYERRPWTYWLSPLLDLPVAIQLWRSAVQRRHVWRGRVLERGGVL